MPTIKEKIKNSCLFDLYKKLSLVYRYPKVILFKKEYKKIRNGVILVGTPLHRNLGDHLIAYAESDFLKDCFRPKQLFEIPTEVFLCFEKYISDNLDISNRVFVSGGGWMGSLWPEDEKNLQHMLIAFKGCKIVVLPQTIFYDKEDFSGIELLNKANEILQNSLDIKVCVRDDSSYQFVLENFKIEKTNVILSPDIALYYEDKTKDRNPLKRVGVFLRNDREKTSEESIIQAIKEKLENEGYSFFYSDTMYSKRVPNWQRKQKIKRTLTNMKRCRLILTDRLHAMIYASIANRKCIVLNNKTGKVFGVYNKWLKWNSNIFYVDDREDDLNSKLVSFLSSTNEQLIYTDVLKNEFDKLKEFVYADFFNSNQK